MSEELYEQIPETLTLREVRFQVTIPGRRTQTLTVVTSLTDADAYTKADIAELYGYRWNAELDIRDIKQTLGLDHVRCKTPGMVRRELWVTLLAYNLVRKLIATAAAVHGKQPRRLVPNQACSSTIRRREPSERSRRSGFAAAGDPVVSRLVGCVSYIVTWVSS
jgi:hypothetical protein